MHQLVSKVVYSTFLVIERITKVFMDDLITYKKPFDECLLNLKIVLKI